MICEIVHQPRIDLPKGSKWQDFQTFVNAFGNSRVVVRACANIPLAAFKEHQKAFSKYLLVEPNQEKNRLNRKRKRFFNSKPLRYPLYFVHKNKFACVPRYFALALTNGTLWKSLCVDGETLTPAQRQKQPKLRLFDYQERVANVLYERFSREGPQGALVEMGCGLGKTFFTIEFIRRFGRRALVVVHQDNILQQWLARFRFCLPGCSIGRVQQDSFEVEGHGVVLCMIHTLCKRPFPPDAFQQFGLVVFDEVHHICAKMFSTCVRHFPCRCRLGLTATPRRKDGLGHVISWLVGPRICRVRRQHQQVKVHWVDDRTEYGPPVVNRKTGQLCYTSMLRRLCANTARTQRIARIVAGEVRQNGRTVLVASGWSKKKHLGHIFKALEPLLAPKLPRARLVLKYLFRAQKWTTFVHAAVLAFLYPTVGFFVGESSKKNKMLRKQLVCLRRVVLTTFKMGEEAMDIPTINTILLAMPKKGMEQMVGRITRGATLDGKLYPKVIDLVDTNVGVCANMADHRRREYKQLGFELVRADAATQSTS